VSDVDELLELLAPLLAGNGSDPAAAGEDGSTDDQPQPQPSKQGER
jgi:hypothetical protein